MKRWMKRSLLGFAASGAFALAVSAIDVRDNHRDRHLLLAAKESDASLISTLQHAFPIGTKLADVHVGLQVRNLDVPDYNDQILVLQGTQPSFEWYCGPLSRYVVFSFSGDADGATRLKNIAREVRGTNCL